ncbi:MAG: Sec-independent protein translocase subunit TatA/TatB [Solirubrobacteraceae bacterium]
MPLIGSGHIWLIGILLAMVLIVWGPGKLPEIGAGMGRAIREFRKASAEPRAEVSTAPSLDTPADSPAVAAADPTIRENAPPPGAP